MLLSRTEEIERMIVALVVVTPSHLKGTRRWKMEPLKDVWMTKEPSVLRVCWNG